MDSTIKNALNNARILIDIPNTLDHDWKIDIKKATATPPVSIKKDLTRLGNMTRKSAGQIYIFRGNQMLLKNIEGFDFQFVWKALKKRDGGIEYYINNSHPLIKKALESNSEDSKELKRIFKIIGETIPIENIIQQYSEEPESLDLRSENNELDKDTIVVAKTIYQSLLSAGYNKDMAIKQILKTQPFDQYPQLIEYFK